MEKENTEEGKKMGIAAGSVATEVHFACIPLVVCFAFGRVVIVGVCDFQLQS